VSKWMTSKRMDQFHSSPLHDGEPIADSCQKAIYEASRVRMRAYVCVNYGYAKRVNYKAFVMSILTRVMDFHR